MESLVQPHQALFFWGNSFSQYEKSELPNAGIYNILPMMYFFL